MKITIPLRMPNPPALQIKGPEKYLKKLEVELGALLLFVGENDAYGTVQELYNNLPLGGNRDEYLAVHPITGER